MLDEDLVEKICKLGLTTKQARLYSSIVVSKGATISEISKKTGLHKQDIYKILPKLEKVGLVTKTMIKPIKVEVIPVETALGNLIEMEQKKVESQKRNVQEIIAAIGKKQSLFSPEEGEGKFEVLPARSEAQMNRVELVFENARRAYDVFIPRELFEAYVPLFTDYFDRLAAHGVIVRIIIRTADESNKLMEVVNKAKWPAVDMTIKATDEIGHLYYAIIDNKEVWIPLETPAPTILRAPTATLVTDSKAVVRIAQENFNKFWENARTRTLFRKERTRTLRKKNVSTHVNVLRKNCSITT